MQVLMTSSPSERAARKVGSHGCEYYLRCVKAKHMHVLIQPGAYLYASNKRVSKNIVSEVHEGRVETPFRKRPTISVSSNNMLINK